MTAIAGWEGLEIPSRLDDAEIVLSPRFLRRQDTYPLITARGLVLATRVAMPAPCITLTTRSISL